MIAQNQIPEICNNLDDDCDGETDEQTTDSGGSCGSSVGNCVQGQVRVLERNPFLQRGRDRHPPTCATAATTIATA